MPPEYLPNLLFLLLLIPLCGGLGLAIMPTGQDKMLKVGAVIFSLATLVVSLVLAWHFNWANPHIQFAGKVFWIPDLALNFGFGIDAISLWLILLTTLISLIAIVGSFTAVAQRVKEFYVWILILEASMLGAFMATDLIFFYVCFEFTLIPIFFLVGIHGSSERLRAAKTFFLYTFTGSLLTFAGILYVAWWNHLAPGSNGDWSFAFADLYASAKTMSYNQQALVMLAMLAGFAVKVPLFPFHTWQPLTYSEAPTAGSILLGAVVLKLATYAIVRLAIPLAPLAAVSFAPWIATLAIIGILYAALICWVQKDLKKLIAYSSMSHMGFCVLGMFALNMIGLTGSVAYMVNHGLSTAALFLCVGMLFERLGTRQITDMGGLARIMPVWAFFMVFFVFTSVGLPGLNGFVGEFLALLGAFTQTNFLGPWYAAFAGIGMILAAIYLLHMTGKLVFGPLKLPQGQIDSPELRKLVPDLNLREIAVLTPLAIGCLWLGIYPQPFLETLERPLTRIVAMTDQAIEKQSALANKANSSTPTSGLTESNPNTPTLDGKAELLSLQFPARINTAAAPEKVQ